MKTFFLSASIVALLVLLAVTSFAQAADFDFSGLRLQVVSIPAVRNTLEEAARIFNEEYGAQVEITYYSGGDIKDRVRLEAISRTGAYDVVILSPWWLGEFYQYLEPLSGYLEDPKVVDPAFDLEDFSTAILNNYVKVNEELYGLPFRADVMMLFYRTDLFNDPNEKAAFEEKYGYELLPPRDWGSFYEVGEFFTRPDDGLFGTALMAKRSHQTSVMWANRLFALGGDYFDKEGNPALTSEQAKEALEMYMKHLAIAPLGALSYEWSESIESFLQGNTAMLEQWAGNVIIWAQDPERSNIQNMVNAVPMPGGFGSSGGWFWAVMKDSKEKLAAYKFIEMICNKEFAKKAWLLDGEMPARSSLYSDPAITETFPAGYAQAFEEALANCVSPPSDSPVSDELKSTLDIYLSMALSGEITVMEALEAAQKNWLEILSR